MAAPQGLFAKFYSLDHQLGHETLRYTKLLRDLYQLHVLEAVHFECPAGPDR